MRDNTPLDRIKMLGAAVLILPVRFYQRFISRYTPRVCRYYPTCSSYMVTALRKHGPVKGLIMGSIRILRCNPWARGGVDYVPDRFSQVMRFNVKKRK